MTPGIHTIDIPSIALTDRDGARAALRMWRRALLVCAALALTACATGPKVDITNIDRSITPQRVTAEVESLRGKIILWGGVIIASTNLKDATQIEVLAFPLDSSHKPDTAAPPLARFLAVKNSYLETQDFAQGRLLTVTGPVTDTLTGQVGEARYVYPVVTPDALYLWPKPGASAGSSVHFGIGVMFHN